MTHPRVCVLILNWNGYEETRECLLSCLKFDYPDYQILVVDNGSRDGSVDKLRAEFKGIQIEANPENWGYAGGNNAGLKRALEQGAEAVLILNNDVSVAPDALTQLVHAWQANPQAGILAPKVLYYDDPSLVSAMGTRMDWFRHRPLEGNYHQKDSGNETEPSARQILVGCALFIPRRTLERIGYLEEKFFIFHEEADWCLRNLASGFVNLMVPRAVIYHKESKTMKSFSALTTYYSARNFLLLARRNASLPEQVCTAAGLGYFFVKNGLGLMSRDTHRRELSAAYFLGVWDFVRGRWGKCPHNFKGNQ